MITLRDKIKNIDDYLDKIQLEVARNNINISRLEHKVNILTLHVDELKKKLGEK